MSASTSAATAASRIVQRREPVNITTTQHYSRAALKALLARGVDLPGGPETYSKLKALKANTLRGGTMTEGHQHITYTLSRKKAGALGYGRCYPATPKASLDTFPADVRMTLCAGIYHDIDMENAQPRLMQQLASRNDIDTPFLDRYIANRDEVLASVSDIRDEAKQAVLKVLFGGGAPAGNDFLVSLKNELRSLTKVLVAQPEYADLWKVCQSEDCKYGSFLSHLTQTLELDCLLSMKSAFETQGWSVEVLVFDGFMVRQRPGFSITPELLTTVQRVVESETGYQVLLAEKPITSLDLPAAAEADNEAYEEMKTEFEKNHFHFRPTNTVVEVNEKGLFHFPIDHARAVLNTWRLPALSEGGKPTLFINQWLGDDKRRLVDELVMKYPADCSEREASLFLGLAHTHLREKGVEPMEGAVEMWENLLAAVCGDSRASTDYMRKWCARLIQNPLEPSRVCNILSSATQGVGKDTFASILGRIVGRYHTAKYSSDSALWEKHDTQMETAVFVWCEEAGVAANKANADALKARITQDLNSINPKGVKPYYVPNVSNWLMTTNNASPVKLEQTNRRYNIMNPSDRLHKSDWRAFHDRIKHDSFIVAIGTYLESIDVKDFNPMDFPVSEALSDMTEGCKESDERYIDHWLDTADANEWYNCTALYDDFRTWCTTTHVDSPPSIQSFVVKIVPHMRKQMMEGRVQRKKFRNASHYKVVRAAAS